MNIVQFERPEDEPVETYSVEVTYNDVRVASKVDPVFAIEIEENGEHAWLSLDEEGDDVVLLRGFTALRIVKNKEPDGTTD